MADDRRGDDRFYLAANGIWKMHPKLRRIDGFLLDPPRTAIEVKISRSDFFNDTSEKREPWKRIAGRFVYLTTPGLVSVDEVPEGCGLWESSGAGIVVVKKAVLNKNPEPYPRDLTERLFWRLAASEQKLRTNG